MKEKNGTKVHVGGQAVIEGVMMRSPEYVSVAVRKPDGTIVVKRSSYLSWTRRCKILGWPLIRGGVVLIESLVWGIRALNFSGDVAMADEKTVESTRSDRKTKILMGLTVIFSLALGIGFFFLLPLFLTELTGVRSGVLFNLIDGLFRLILFLLYLFLISRWKEIRRVFEYHGAEHKSIFAYEQDRPLTLEGVKSFSTHHPRCGTSFLLVVVLVSILVFVFLGRPENLLDRLIRFLFIPLIGGISYEIIRLSSRRAGRLFSRLLTAPGLWLQNITTREPDDEQLEVGLTALRCALGLEPGIQVKWADSVKGAGS
ncbi:MAG TPA: DUF1385 domain-containing protein [bacterium]|nr:DUF1385 domain-containing protein [bacterium]